MTGLKHNARAAVRRLVKGPHRETPPPARANTLLVPGNQWYRPALGGASTLARFIVGGAVVRDALGVLERLAPDAYLDFVREFYTAGLARFGDRWQYADINTALIGIGGVLQPARALEIGLRRGRSTAMLASTAPTCDIVGCDLWIPDYAGMANPGAEVVREQLAAVGHRGAIDFLDGDSHVVLPKYFHDHPDAFFDVITVDGDHTTEGARADLRTVAPRVNVGGVLVFDDVSNHSHPTLRRVWDDTLARDPRFSTFMFTEVGFGVAIAVRMY